MKKIAVACFLGLALSSSAQDSISVLYIGNSYTYANDLPATVSSLATSLGKKTTFQTKANGGYTFQNHANDPATYAAIQAKPWDVVVIQGQSQEPSFPYSQVNNASIPFAKKLSDSVYANNSCGNVMYFMTWGREVGDPQWDSINTFDKMNQRLYNAYMRIADSSKSAMVSPVGAVWKYVRDNYPTIALYTADGSHPSEAGTYLAACTFFTSLFRTSPVGAMFIGNLNAQTALNIQQSVAAVLMNDLSTYRLHPVSEPTVANFSMVLSSNEVSTQNLSAQATSYQWEFGDGQISTIISPSHVYAATGTFDMKLIALSSCNADTLIKQLNVQQLGLEEATLSSVFWIPTEDGFEVHGVSKGTKISVFDDSGRQIINEMNVVESLIVIHNKSRNLLVNLVSENDRAITIRMTR